MEDTEHTEGHSGRNKPILCVLSVLRGEMLIQSSVVRC
jgi:hypothetical protein